eukprot:6192699-Pleurochrysis_carterae.AAC.3
MEPHTIGRARSHARARPTRPSSPASVCAFERRAVVLAARRQLGPDQLPRHEGAVRRLAEHRLMLPRVAAHLERPQPKLLVPETIKYAQREHSDFHSTRAVHA